MNHINDIVECDNCGAKYYLGHDAPNLPKLHTVCSTCFLTMEIVNPFYKYPKEVK